MHKAILVFAALSSLAASAHAQRCNEHINLSVPTARYVDNGNGTATDVRTGLTWQRCPVGYTFNDNGTSALTQDDRCSATGTATFTWEQALNGAVALNQQGGYAGFTNWRLPNLKELASLLEAKCEYPRVNTTVFPSTPSATFLSATPSFGTNSYSSQGINFATGASAGVGSNTMGYVRLVR